MGSEEEREAGQGGKSRVAGQQAPAVAQSTARFREGKLLGRRSRNAVMCGRDSRADPSTTSMTTSPGGRGRRRTLQPCRVGFLFKEWGRGSAPISKVHQMVFLFVRLFCGPRCSAVCACLAGHIRASMLPNSFLRHDQENCFSGLDVLIRPGRGSRDQRLNLLRLIVGAQTFSDL